MKWLTLAVCLVLPQAGFAEDLYKPNNFAAMASDRVARQIGDALTVVVFEQTETSNTVKLDSRRNSQVGGTISAGRLNETGNLQAGGSTSGIGGLQRSDRVVAQISVEVRQVLPNGDLVVGGRQQMRINGERTQINLEGRIRQADISSENRVLSSRIANAQIFFEGRGFVAGSAKPGIVSRIFRFLGLG